MTKNQAQWAMTHDWCHGITCRALGQRVWVANYFARNMQEA